MDPSFKPYFLMGKFMYGILPEFSMNAVQLIRTQREVCRMDETTIGKLADEKGLAFRANQIVSVRVFR